MSFSLHVSCRGGFRPFFGSVGFWTVVPLNLSAGGYPMITLSHQLSLQAQAPALRSIAGANGVVEREVLTARDVGESTWTRGRDGADNYLLPSGIVSMDHWLDLNA
jgi:hypothetical protein